MKALSTLLLLFLITGCINTGRYSHRNDSAPSHVPTELQLTAAEPRYVEPAAANSRPYTVFGKEYFPMQSAKGYEAEGEASWYGQKFHGHLTANGEIYNMYHMTAAHRTLPLPSFVRVTNLENGLSTIVKVNDRGPFHDNRVIDLSWAAAKKLDVLKTGTVRVKLQVIHVAENGLITIGKGPETEITEQPEDIQHIANAQQSGEQKSNTTLLSPSLSTSAEPLAIAEANGVDHITDVNSVQNDAETPAVQNDAEMPVTQKATFIQVATLNNASQVEELARGLSFLFHLPTHTPKTDAGTQIRLGPIQEGIDIQGILKQLRDKGFRDAFKVTTSL